MDNTKHPAPSNPDRPCQSRYPVEALSEAHREWERLLDAGLIGRPLPLSAETLAVIAHNEAILRGGALYRRQQVCAPFWVPGR